MAGDDSRAPSRREALMLSLDWTRPSGPLEWVSCVAPVVTQAVAGAGHWVFFEYWMSRLPLPLTTADRDHDCWWLLSMRQIEVSRTLVFDDPRRVRTVFEQLLAGNMNLGPPSTPRSSSPRKSPARHRAPSPPGC